MIAVGIALALASVAVLIASLDRPWLKRRVEPAIRAYAGVDVVYEAVRFRPLSGVTVEGLVVRTPGDLGRVAPVLARIERIEVGWSVSSIAGHGPSLERVRAQGVEITVVSDDRGRTSVDAFSSGPSRPPARPTPPLSRIVAEALRVPPPAAGLDLSDVALTWVRAVEGRELDRFTARGLTAHVAARRADHGWRLDASVGSAPGGAIELRRAPAGGSAQLEAALTAGVTAAELATVLDVRVRDQTFRPDVKVRELAHVEAGAVFDPIHGSTEISIQRTYAADRAVALEAQLAVPDDRSAPVVVRRAQGTVGVAELLRIVPPGLLPVEIARGQLAWRADALQVSLGPRIALRGTVTSQGELTGIRLRLPDGVASISAGRYAVSASAEGGTTAVRASVALDTFEVRTAAARISSRSIDFGLESPLRSGPPFSARASARASMLRAYDAKDRLVLGGPARLDLRVDDLIPDLERPAASRAVLHADAAVGGVRSSLDAKKQPDAVEFAWTARGEGRSVAELLVPAVEAQAPAHTVSVSLSATGRVERLSSANPRIENRAELRVDRPGLRRLRVDRITLGVRSSGDLWRHRAEGDLTLHAPEGVAPVPEPVHVTFSASLDRRRPSLVVHLRSDAEGAVALSGSLALDRAAGVLRYDLDGRVERLAPLAALFEPFPALAPLDLSSLALELAAHGTVGGVVVMSADGGIRVSPDPLAVAVPRGTFEVKARGVRWNGSDLVLDVPAAAWRADLQSDGPRGTIRTTLEAEQLRAFAGDQELEATGLTGDVVTVLERNLSDSTIELRPRVRLRSLRHHLGAYPVGDVELTANVRRLPEGVFRIADLRLDNRAAGTQVQLRGGVDLGHERRRRFSIRGELQQDVARLWTDPETFQGRGQLAATVRIDSSDLAVFQTQAALRLHGVNATAARAGVSVVDVDGEIPITANVAVEGRRVTLLRGFEANPFAVHRFADQHPLISRGSFLSAARIESPFLSIAPLAGNVNVDQNVISLSQLEMGVRGGRVTGQCVINWEGEDSTAWAHLRATGVQSSHGEPFDGNAAIVLSAEERSIDGRLEILRIGSRHLLDLLDLQDPHHADPATNRIRYALGFGYPDRVRVGFNHGFANLHITFGGLARFVTVGDLRGIPTGPLVDRVLAPFSKPEER